MWNVFAGKGGAVCMLAEILVNRPSKHLDRTFTYRIPEKFHWLRPGWRCAVPFAGRTEEGFILSIRQEDAVPMPYPVKDIEMPVDDYPWFTGEMMELARWIASYYMCTYLDALRLFLIDKKGIQTFSFYEVCWDKIPEDHAVRALLDDSISVLTEEEASALWNGEELRLLTEQAFLVRREDSAGLPHASGKMDFAAACAERSSGEREKAERPVCFSPRVRRCSGIFIESQRLFCFRHSTFL